MPQHTGPIRQALRAMTGGESPHDMQVRHAAWVARCVGRGPAAPLSPDDVAALAGIVLPHRLLARGRFSSVSETFAASSDIVSEIVARTPLG